MKRPGIYNDAIKGGGDLGAGCGFKPDPFATCAVRTAFAGAYTSSAERPRGIFGIGSPVLGETTGAPPDTSLPRGYKKIVFLFM